MMIGYIKGYEICNITKRKIEKGKIILSEIKKIDNNITEKINSVLNNKGCIFGLKEKNNLKAIYLFENVKEDGKKILKFEKCVYTKDVESKKEEFEKAITEELKEKVTFEDYTKVYWDDIEITPKEIGNISTGASSGLIMGLIYGIIFNNLALGLLVGISIGLCFGVAVKKKDK